MLRKRGADAGARGSWAPDFIGLVDSPGSGEDRIAAVHTTADQKNGPHDGSSAHDGDSPSPADAPAAMFGLGMLDAVDMAVDAATSNFVSNALRFMSLEDSPPRAKARPAASPSHPASPAAASQSNHPSGQGQRARRSASPAASQGSPLIKLDTSLSFFNQGLDAINGVGRLVEGFAVSLDNVIGQALDDWAPVAPAAPGRELKKKVVKPVGVLPTPSPAASGRGQTREDWGDFDVENEEGAPCSSSGGGSGVTVAPRREGVTPRAAATPGAPAAAPHALTATSQTAAKEIQQWRRRAQILQKELQKLRAQRDEYLKVKEEYETLQEKLREGGGVAAPSTDATPGTPADPLAAEQVMRQMETLVAEKALLAAENDRLLRENSGLHELLQFTMQQHVAHLGDDELFAEDAEGSGECEGAMEEEDSFCSAADGGSALIEEISGADE